MDTIAHTIEDLLEVIAGLRQSPKFKVDSSDVSIINSIARQVFKGTALTDRQFILMQEKLQKYKDQFEELNHPFEVAVETLRQPLRHIDRSKYIKFVEYIDYVGSTNVYESWKGDLKLIKVRFPFSKKLIVELQSFNIPNTEHLHNKGTHEHYFVLNEFNCYEVVSKLKDKNFEIDSEVVEYYEKIRAFEDKEKYVGSILNYEFNNVHPNAMKHAVSELGEPCAENIVKYKDRSSSYGISLFDYNLDQQLLNNSVLTQKIASRSKKTIFISSKEWTFGNLVDSLFELDRLPVAILINETDPYNDLTSTHRYFKHLIDNNDVSVQFRLPSGQSNGFNEYIKDNGLNSPVDKNTKVVYTSREKLNKPLLISNCKPRTAILMQSQRLHTKMQYWLADFDLVIHYDTEMSHFISFEAQRIERL